MSFVNDFPLEAMIVILGIFYSLSRSYHPACHTLVISKS